MFLIHRTFWLKFIYKLGSKNSDISDQYIDIEREQGLQLP